MLIQYSGRMAVTLIASLLRQSATVTLYLKEPASAVSKLQSDRISKSISDFESEFEECRNGKLTVYYYNGPGAMRAVPIDGKTLAAGWYLYKHPPRTHENPPEGEFKIHGYDAPGVLCNAGKPGFDVLFQTFEDLVADFEDYNKAKGRGPVLMLDFSSTTSTKKRVGKYL